MTSTAPGHGHDEFLAQLAAKWAEYQRVLEDSRYAPGLHEEVERLYQEALAFSQWGAAAASSFDQLQAELGVNPGSGRKMKI